MKSLIKAGIVIASLAVLATASFAGQLTGIWHGNIRFDATKLPNTADPNQKKMMMAQIKVEQNVRITLTMKPDHTYTLQVFGSPKPRGPIAGTWSQNGSAITMTETKAGKAGTPRTFTLARDSKSFMFTQGALTMSFFK